jgi:TonB-linked SusC/RagA family outer membrane protein
VTVHSDKPNSSGLRKILFLSLVIFSSFTASLAQNRSISGRVTSTEDGTPIPGVNVVVEGTTNGTVTDIDGYYKILLTNEGVLLFSFIGSLSQEVVTAGRTIIDVTMDPDVTQLSEVVVTAIGIEVNKRAIGYSIQNVDAEEVVQARENNLVNALSAKVAGVQVISSSGSPGASSRIRIRGSTSITGNNDPLFIIDGVPIDNSSFQWYGTDQSNRVIDVNANDVESFTILKGPAATVLYGIRAANGAIIITTKKGQAGKSEPTINVSMAYTAEKVNRLPEFQLQYAQGKPVNGVPTWLGPETNTQYSWGPAISSLEFDGDPTYQWDRNGALVPKGTGNGNPAKAYDNLGNYFVTGQTWDANVSVAGGSDKVNYFASAERLQQTGVVPNTDFQRTSVRATIGAQITKKLRIGASANYIESGSFFKAQKGSNISGVGLGLYRTTPTFDNGNGKTGQEAADDPSSYEFADGRQRAYNPGNYDNPYWTINKNPNNVWVDRIIGYASVGYEIIPGLKFDYKIGLDQWEDNKKGGWDVNGATFGGDGYVFQDQVNSKDINSDLLLSYTKEINENFRFKVLAGHNFVKQEKFNWWSNGREFSIPGLFTMSNATDIKSFERVWRRKINGVFAATDLEIFNQIYVNLSARNDWASTLPAANNSFFYPAASIAWDFTEGLGLKEGNILSYGKIRASWGQAGNDAPAFVTSNYFNTARIRGDGFISSITFPQFGTNGYQRSLTIGSNQLRPETTTTIEIGTNLTLFKGRLTLDYTYFDSKSVDQIIPAYISSVTGWWEYFVNAGEVRNWGHEVVIDGTPLELGGFTWQSSLNLTILESRVNKVAEFATDGIIYLYGGGVVKEGEPYGVFYGTRYQRTEEGKLIIDQNGWPLLNINQGIIGDPNPDWLAGWRNTFSWKGLSLNTLLDVKFGGDMWNGTEAVSAFHGTAKITGDLRETKGYVFDGVVMGPDSTYTANTTPVDLADPANPAGVNGYFWTRYGFLGVDEQYIQDASWIRLREVTLTYSFPASWMSKIGMEAASIAFTGRNLFLYTPYRGIDPEHSVVGAGNGTGFDYFGMPNTKSYGVIINLTF